MTRRELLDKRVAEGTTYKGTINGFHGSWLSGLGTLVIGGLPVHCENGATVRALDACFGDVIGPGHTVCQEAIAGKEIYYDIDFIGVLDGFTPADSPELDEEVEEQCVQ